LLLRDHDFRRDGRLLLGVGMVWVCLFLEFERVWAGSRRGWRL
jgi:hypothetical protein